jgi:predicted metal-dependent hydrolase
MPLFPERKYENGEAFLYKGASLVLADAPPGAPRVSASDGKLYAAPAAPEERRKFILYWYTAETERYIRAALPAWAKKLRARPRCVEVKNAKTRWGSRSTSGRLFFNARLSMLPEDVAEYVVVHELCHFKQMNHGAEFWKEVSAALPDARRLRKLLRGLEREAVL